MYIQCYTMLFGSKVVMFLFHSSLSLSLLLLYPPIDSNDVAIGIKMVDVLEGVDAESN